MSNSKESASLFNEFPPVSKVEWEKAIQQDLGGADYREKLRWKTGEGVEALPFYREEDLSSLTFLQGHISYRKQKNNWNISQPVFDQDIEDANRSAGHALQNGADALWFKYQILATAGMLGGDLAGTAIQNQRDFEALFDNIDPARTILHFDSGMASPVLLAMLHNMLETRQTDASAVQGTLMYDPYAFIITSGQFPKQEKQFIREAHQMTAFCHNTFPQMRCLGVDAQVFHNAGATIVQELGYALAVGNEYLAGLTDTGLSIDEIAPHMHFSFAIGSNYFLEIAKLRAARILWKMVTEAYGPDRTESSVAYLHGHSSEWNKTVFDPHTNMLRATAEGMAGAIAGCDSVTLHPFDRTYKQPDDFSLRMARNIQMILKEETYLNQVVDPSAGSYYLEVLTDRIANAAWECFREVEQQGGMLKAIRGGYVQTAIEESREQRDRTIAERGRVFVGVNKYAPVNENRSSEPDSNFSTVSLKTSDTPADIDKDNLIESLAKTLRDGAQLGNIVPSLMEVGKQDIRPLRPYRGTQAFEALRNATARHHSIPKILTLPLGNKKLRRARSEFAVNFFSCAGYDIDDPVGFDSVGHAVKAVKEKQPDVVVLCSSDSEYERLIPQLKNELRKLNNKPMIVVAGYTENKIEKYKSAGVDSFIHRDLNVLEKLAWFQRQLGVVTDKNLV